MKKKVISKETIQVGNKHYTEEKYWARFPSDRIITTRTRKLTFGDLFNVLELVALTWIGFFLMKFFQTGFLLTKGSKFGLISFPK